MTDRTAASATAAGSTVAIVGCLDTKGAELAFLRDVIAHHGLRTWVVDAGVLGEPAFVADTPSAETAAAAGSSLEELRRRNDRGHAMEVMCRGARAIVERLHAEGAIQGVIGAGGSANTTVAASAMRALPVGVPKLIVSTLASGDVSPWVDVKDVAVMYSVVDVAGINRISARILSNAGNAIAGMVLGAVREPGGDRPIVAATMFGVTTPCVNEARRLLEEAGYEVLVFHATGSGGRAMEGLIRDGFVAGVLDLTTTELADELVGGILSAGPERLTVAGRCGVPQVVSTGALDMVNFGPPETVPEKFRDRTFYRHNPSVTLMRTTAEENEELGRRIAERLRGASAAVEVLLPARGVSMIDVEGRDFWDPEADRRCRDAIRRGVRDDFPVREIDTDINDPAFAREAAETLMRLMREPRGGGEA